MLRALAPWTVAIFAMVLPAASVAEVTISSDARTVRITKADCTRLVKHEPSDDVAYRAGVDVHGRSVAPADLDAGAEIVLPEVLVIPIEADVLGDGKGADDRSFRADARLGLVEVDTETGRVAFNGRPISGEARHELSRRCQEILRGE